MCQKVRALDINRRRTGRKLNKEQASALPIYFVFNIYRADEKKAVEVQKKEVKDLSLSRSVGKNADFDPVRPVVLVSKWPLQ